MKKSGWHESFEWRDGFTRYVQSDEFKSLNDRKERAKKVTKITWEDVMDYIGWLDRKTEGKKYVGVYGVPRRGLLLAVLFSCKTGLPLLQAPVEGCLVMDDDSISRFSLAPYFGRYDIAVYAKHPNNKINIEYVYEVYDDENWRVFPWQAI